jgi:hypothetical protein
LTRRRRQDLTDLEEKWRRVEKHIRLARECVFFTDEQLAEKAQRVSHRTGQARGHPWSYPADPQRVIRLVVRRCRLNLLELRPGRVVVHFWGTQGQADLRPFFKQHSLAKQGVEVFLIDRKRETTTAQTGADFLYGERLGEAFPLDVYLEKRRRRAVEEPDDWTAAPHTWSGYAWNGVEPNRIPWAALKSAWRRTTPMLCPNCDEPTTLTNFGLPQWGMFNREARFVHACRQCRRRFQDYSIDRFDVATWLVSNLDAEVLPDFILWMGKPVRWMPPASDTRTA